MTSRYAFSPSDFKTYDSERIRSLCIIKSIFIEDQVTATYFHDDRMIVGGAFPVKKKLDLKTYPELKSACRC